MQYEMTVTYRSANCSLIVWEDEDTITISSLFCEFRKRGHATHLMDKVVKIANALDKNLILRVQPYGMGEKMSKKQLKRFYASFGFQRCSGDIMVRSRKEQGL